MPAKAGADTVRSAYKTEARGSSRYPLLRQPAFSDNLCMCRWGSAGSPWHTCNIARAVAASPTTGQRHFRPYGSAHRLQRTCHCGIGSRETAHHRRRPPSPPCATAPGTRLSVINCSPGPLAVPAVPHFFRSPYANALSQVLFANDVGYIAHCMNIGKLLVQL